MLRRKQSMPFAPGAYVFPGGSVDTRDADADVAWSGPDVTEWARWLGSTPALARGLLCAAVRETFEESGVLLAGASPDDGTVPPAEDLEPDRLALLDRSLSLAGLLARRGLVLRSDLLKPWARWITPELESRRYDTRFFAAVLPERQRTREIRDEADEFAWLRPPDVLAAAGRGEVALMPPTAVTLAELAGCGDVAAALAAPRADYPAAARDHPGRRARVAEHAGRAGVPAVTADTPPGRPGWSGPPSGSGRRPARRPSRSTAPAAGARGASWPRIRRR